METGNASVVPEMVCGCGVIRAMADTPTFLVVGVGDRMMVLKPLDPDCLHNNNLHPAVRDRLSRVRELAHSNVANLYGVERDGDVAYLMWEYLEGVPFSEYAAAQKTLRDMAVAARELALAVDLLHAQGLVHGALVPSNALVGAGGVLRLTHISPLLYTDPAVDIECAWDMLSEASEKLGVAGAPLAQLIDDARAHRRTLRELAARLSALIEAREVPKPIQPTPLPSANPRRRALAGAVLTAGAGLLIAWVAWHWIEGGRFSLPTSFHVPFLGSQP